MLVLPGQGIISILIGLTLIGLVAILYSVSRSILLGTFRELEAMDVVSRNLTQSAVAESSGRAPPVEPVARGWSR